jgi:uncharacterized membrane protein YfhO
MITAMLGEDETVEVFKPATQKDDPVLKNINTGKADNHLSYKVDDKSESATLSYTYSVPKNTELYFYYPSRYMREVTLEVRDKDSVSYGADFKFGGSDTTRITSLGESTTGDLFLKVTIDNDSNNLYILERDSYVYYIDLEVLSDVTQRLSRSEFVIDASSTDSHLTGTVTTADDRQLMFTSIPYDEGWNVYVDGKQVEICEANQSLVAFYVEGAGEHTLEMRYMPRVVSLGLSISLVSLVVFLILLIAYPFIKKSRFSGFLMLIGGEELPAVATPEYMAEIEPGDVGAPMETGGPTMDEELAARRARREQAKKAQRAAAKEGKNTKTGNKKKPFIPPKKKP